MKVCPYCNKDLPDDSVYCTYCGKPLEKIKQKDIKKDDNTANAETIVNEPALKKNPRSNPFGKLGFFLYFIALFGLDFIIATVAESLGENSDIAFYISTVFYILSIVCGTFSLYVDHKDKKNGYEPNGGMAFAIMSIIMSSYTLLININGVFLV